MMKIEAEMLLGRELDNAEFEHLNHVYLESSLDKQAVCEAWGNEISHRLLIDLADMIVHYRNEFSKLNVSHKEVTSKVMQMEEVADKVERLRVAISDCSVTFDRATMKFSYHSRERRKTIEGRLFYTSDSDRRLKYESSDPIPQEVEQVFEMLGLEITGPL